MAVSNKKTGVLINMDKELKIKLEKLAKEDRRSLTAYINILLEEHIRKIENKSN